MKHGKFIISLDFELLWGVLDLPAKDAYKKNVLGGRNAIPQILELFERYGIHATWAVVGLLLFENREQLNNAIPELKPQYYNKECSAYNHLENIGNNETEYPYIFGKSLVEQIINSKGQEIATHTFSHYYCNEKGADVESFKADIKTAVATIKDLFRKDVTSLVFPRNQAKDDFIKAAAEVGITCWRGNPKGYTTSGNQLVILLMRLIRLVDSYLPVCGHLCTDFSHNDDGVVCCCASRFFRAYNKKLKIFETLKLNRIKKQMFYAAKNNLVFHLWWHPHNFGEHTEIMLKQLDELLKYYEELKEIYGFKSCTMKDYSMFGE